MAEYCLDLRLLGRHPLCCGACRKGLRRHGLLLMTKDIIKFYDKFKGESSDEARQGWLQQHSQRLNFIDLLHLFIHEKEKISILDVGCGLGDLSAFLSEHEINHDYTGWDINERYINQGLKKYPGINIQVKDVLESTESDAFDYCVGSGLVSFKVGTDEVQDGYLRSVMDRLFSLCRKGMGMNFLSLKFKEDSDLYYYHPFKIMAKAMTFTSSVVLNHDFKTDQFSVFLYKNGSRISQFLKGKNVEEEMSWLLRSGLHGEVLKGYKRNDLQTGLSWVMYAIAMMSNGDLKGAVSIFREHQAIPLGMFYLGYCCLEMGMKEEGLRYLEKAKPQFNNDIHTTKLIERMINQVAKI